MKKKKHYFWYSAKQRTVRNEMFPKGSHCEVLIPGQLGWQTYTEWTRNNKPFGNWDDYVFLGSILDGEHWQNIKVNGVRQG